jgi:hypothetical protein
VNASDVKSLLAMPETRRDNGKGVQMAWGNIRFRKSWEMHEVSEPVSIQNGSFLLSEVLRNAVKYLCFEKAHPPNADWDTPGWMASGELWSSSERCSPCSVFLVSFPNRKPWLRGHLKSPNPVHRGDQSSRSFPYFHYHFYFQPDRQKRNSLSWLDSRSPNDWRHNVGMASMGLFWLSSCLVAMVAAVLYPPPFASRP